MLQIILAIIAGLLTIGAPCILPLLPILLASSVGRTNKLRPLFIIGGFIISFSTVALFLSYIVSRFMIAPDSLRIIAIIGLSIFGLFMIFPQIFEILIQKLQKVTNKANTLSQKTGTGNKGGFILGILLGIIWTPCAGPVLGTILTLIATSTDLVRSGLLLIAYAIGAGIPMIIIAYGSQYVTTNIASVARYSKIIQQIFGIIVITWAAAMFFHYDLIIQAKILEYYPALGPGL